MNKNSLVTVVVPTRNSAEYLSIVLQSIKTQSYPNVEIIVVDNNSTDNTKKIAARYTDKVFNYGPERSYQKNLGAQKAKGDYVLFLDSDAQLTENVLKECVELGENGYDMIIIPEKHVGVGFWAKAKALERECFLNDDTIEAPWFFNRKSFLAVGGYDERMFAGEDWDLFERMRGKGFTYARNKSFIHHHLGQLKFWHMVRKKLYYGKNLNIFISKNKKSFWDRIPFLRKAYLKNWRLLLKHPILTSGFMTLKIAESLFVLAGLIGYKFSELKR